MLEGWNNETVLHENRPYFPRGEKMYCFFALQHGGNDVTWKFSINTFHCKIVDACKDDVDYVQLNWINFMGCLIGQLIQTLKNRPQKHSFWDVWTISIKTLTSVWYSFLNKHIRKANLQWFGLHIERVMFMNIQIILSYIIDSGQKVFLKTTLTWTITPRK